MKDITLLTWLTQLGLSVAFPLGGFILLALWLKSSCGWGSWVLWVGILLGLVGAIDGLRTSLKAMSRIAKPKKGNTPPSVSFNDHD